MPRRNSDRRAYLLSENLDMILAAGEDLKLLSVAHARETASVTSGRSVHTFVRRAKVLEFAAIARLMRAREYASDIARANGQFAQLARLFVSGTETVIDAVEDIADSGAQAFANGDDPFLYLRSRGLLVDEAEHQTPWESLNVTDSFLIAGRIELGALLDLAAALLDALDAHFKLFPDADARCVPRSVARAEIASP